MEIDQHGSMLAQSSLMLEDISEVPELVLDPINVAKTALRPRFMFVDPVQKIRLFYVIDEIVRKKKMNS